MRRKLTWTTISLPRFDKLSTTSCGAPSDLSRSVNCSTCKSVVPLNRLSTIRQFVVSSNRTIHTMFTKTIGQCFVWSWVWEYSLWSCTLWPQSKSLSPQFYISCTKSSVDELWAVFNLDIILDIELVNERSELDFGKHVGLQLREVISGQLLILPVVSASPLNDICSISQQDRCIKGPYIY